MIKKIKPLVKQINLLFKFLRFRIFLILGVSIVAGLQPTALIYLYKVLIDNLILTTDKEIEIRLSYIIGIIVLQFLLVILMHILLTLLNWLTLVWSSKMTLHITGELYRKLQRINYAQFEDPKTHDTFLLATSQLQSTPMRILDNFINIVQLSVSLISMSIVLVTQNWIAMIPAILISIPSFILETRFSKQKFKIEKNRAQMRRKENYLKQLLFKKTYAMELSFFEHREKLTKRMISIVRLLFRQDIIVSKKYYIKKNIVQILAEISYWGYYVFLVICIIAKKYTIGDFALYTRAFNSIQESVEGILLNISKVYSHTLFINNYYDFLALPEDNLKTGSIKKSTIDDSIKFINVYFTYPNTIKQVLKNVNITINKYDNLAIVGENGSGKSTFIKLLLGFYNNYTGQILIDGIELRTLDRSTLWRLFGVVFQDYQPYFFTAKENIGMAAIDNNEQIEKIEESAYRSRSDVFINKLPKKYNNVLGCMFEGGQELSRGQWQTIAIARCFIRESHFFIMDEPTASIDPKSEFEIYKQFHKHCNNRTSLLISQRLSNVINLDRIIVFNDGEIIEEGDHITLLKRKGKYADLFSKQSSGYKNKLTVCQ